MDDVVMEELQVDDAWLDSKWQGLQQWLHESFGVEPGIEGILFLIGIQVSGLGYQPRLKKERKQDLIMDGTRRVFERIGLYRQAVSVGVDAPSWERTGRRIPELSIEQQEKLLKVAILRYFSEQSVGIES